MAVPTFVNAGTGVSGTGTSLAPGYPASLAAGDWLFLQTGARSGTTADTPTDFASQSSDLNGGIRQQVFAKAATGSESGTLTVTFSGGSAFHTARLYAFRGTNNSLEAAALATGNNTTLAHPAVTTLGADRLVVAFTC